MRTDANFNPLNYLIIQNFSCHSYAISIKKILSKWNKSYVLKSKSPLEDIFKENNNSRVFADTDNTRDYWLNVENAK